MRATPRINTSRFGPLSSTEALLAAPPEPPEPTVGPEGSVLPPSMTVEAKSPMPPVKNEPRLVTVSPRNVAVVDPASVKVRTKPARTLGWSGKPPPLERKSGVWGKSVYVRGDRGGRRLSKKKKK